MQSNTKTKQQEVYSVTGFSDIIESPVFYFILVLTFILGISSIFGFLQNPRKLKSVVDVINQKVAVYNTANSRNYNTSLVAQNKYSLPYDSSSVSTSYDDSVSSDRYSLLSNNFDLSKKSQSSLKAVSFNYDISSKQFWGNLKLDSTDLDNSPFLITPLATPLSKSLF